MSEWTLPRIIQRPQDALTEIERLQSLVGELVKDSEFWKHKVTGNPETNYMAISRFAHEHDALIKRAKEATG